jgi:hypothetical protein
VNKLSDAVLTIRTHDRGTKDKAMFTPAFNVPAIPRGVSPDFSLHSDGNPRSVEGNLKTAVMKIDVSNAVGTVGVSAVGLVGMGGVGKTSALICVCHDADFQAEVH